MIDTGRLDPSKPIDLAAICNSKAYKIDRNGRQFGVNLVSKNFFSDSFLNMLVGTYIVEVEGESKPFLSVKMYEHNSIL